MKKSLFGTTVIALAIVGAGVAHAARNSVSIKTLRGPYVFEIGGFDENDASATPPHTGDVSALGVVKFDGNGGFAGTLTFTSADSGGDQASCVENITSGSYNITSMGAPGTGTLSLTFPAHATTGSDSSGTINFSLVVPSPDGEAARILENDNSISSLTICGEPIRAAERESKQLAHDAEVADNLRDLIDRVQLESGGIRVSLNLKRLIAEAIDTREDAKALLDELVA